MWYRLPMKLQTMIARKILNLGYTFNKQRMVIWGITHIPMIIEDDLEEA
jgi:hypothetical protein